MDEGSEGNITDSDDDTPADAANESAPIPEFHITLHWKRGTGSKSTRKRARRHQRDLDLPCVKTQGEGQFEKVHYLNVKLNEQQA